MYFKPVLSFNKSNLMNVRHTEIICSNVHAVNTVSNTIKSLCAALISDFVQNEQKVIEFLQYGRIHPRIQSLIPLFSVDAYVGTATNKHRNLQYSLVIFSAKY